MLQKIIISLLLFLSAICAFSQPRFVIGGGASFAQIPKWNSLETWAAQQNTTYNLQGADQIALPKGYNLMGWQVYSQVLLKKHFLMGGSFGANKGFAMTYPLQNGEMQSYEARFRRLQLDFGTHFGIDRIGLAVAYTPGFYGTIIDSIHRDATNQVLGEKRNNEISIRHGFMAQMQVNILRNLGVCLRYDYRLNRLNRPETVKFPINPMGNVFYPMSYITASIYLRFRFREMD